MTSRALALLLFFFVGQNLHAQAPANDNRANAIALSGDTATSSASNANATTEPGDLDARTIWWRWTVGGSGLANFSTTGSTISPRLQIYILEGGVATGLAAYTIGTSVSLPVASGTTFLIGAGVASTGSATGTVQMAVSLNRTTYVGGLNVPNPATMANNSFAQRIALAGASVTGIAYNSSATREAGEPSVSDNNTHWWTYTPSATGRMSVSTQGSSTSFSKTVVVYLGTSLADLKPFIIRTATDVDSFTFPVTAGTTYVLSTGSSNPSAHGTTVLTCALQSGTGVDVSAKNIPNQATMVNDSFANAVTLAGRNVSAIAYNYPATREVSEPDSTGYNTFWWKHEVVENGRLSIDTIGSSTSFYKNLCVFMGTTLGGLKLVHFQQSAETPSLSLPVTAGTVFYISTGSSNPNFHGSWVMNLDLQTGAGVDVSAKNIPNQATLANDSFASAVTLTGRNVSAIAYNYPATREVSEPDSTGYNTFWWKHEVVENGRLSIDTAGSSTAFYKNLCVFMGTTLGGLKLVHFQQSAETPSLSLPVTAGTVFYISTGSSNPNFHGSWVLNIDLRTGTGVDVSGLNIPNQATLVNDSFAQAVSLNGDTVSAVAYNYPATRENGEPTSTGYNTFWWRARPSKNGRLSISTRGSGTEFNKSVMVYQGSGSLASLRLVAFAQNTSEANVSFPVTADTDYIICTGSSNQYYHGSWVITLDLQSGAGVDISSLNIPNPATMANDSLAGAVTLSGREVSGIAYNYWSGRETSEPAISGYNTHWWRYTADAAGILSLSTQGSDTSFSKTVVVYQGSNFSDLRTVATTRSSDTINFSLPVTADTTYYISTGSSNEYYQGSLVLTLGLQTGPGVPVSNLNFPARATMANDSFAQRVTLSGAEVSAIAYTQGATREALEPTGTGFRTIWFSWTAPVSGSAIIDLTHSNGDSLNATVWQGDTVGTLTPVERSAWTGMRSSFVAAAGQTYHIAPARTSDSASGSSIVMTLFAPPSAPIFDEPLPSTWLEAGASLTLTASAGGNGTTYRWQRNGAFMANATARTYQASGGASALAGAYRVEARNNLGTVLSTSAHIGVMDVSTQNVATGEGNTLRLTVPAHGPAGALSYRWMKGGVDLSDGRSGTQTIKGSSAPSLTISGFSTDGQGSYQCRVTMSNPAAPVSPLVKLSGLFDVTMIPRPVVTDTPPPAAAVSQPFTWQLAAQNSPASFAATGLPRGLVLDKTTGLVTGAPQAAGGARVSVTATNAAGVSAARVFSFTIGGLRSGVAGTYSGLVGRHQALNARLGGTITATISSTGALTGSLKLGTSSHGLTGRVTTPPSAPATARVVVKRSRLPVLTVLLDFHTDGSLDGEVFEGETAPLNEANVADVDGWLKTWRAGNTAAAHAGAYNALLDLPAELAGDDDTPQGYGYLQMSVTAATGAVSITGRTPDGASITASGTLWPDGKVPLHSLLYSNKGSIRGLPRITLAGSAPAYADNRATGDVDWLKTGPASASDRTYAAGFGPIVLDVDGSKWVRPAAKAMLFDLPNQPGNLRIELGHGGIASAAQSADVNQTFQLLPTGVCKFASATGGNPTGMNLSVKTATGLVTGGFKLSDPKPGSTLKTPRPVKLAGLFIPHLQRGYGHYLLPELPPGTKVLAGSMLLRAP